LSVFATSADLPSLALAVKAFELSSFTTIRVL
jgi:hypothetical protein